MEELIIYLRSTDVNQSLWRIGKAVHLGEINLLRELADKHVVRVFVNAQDVLLLKATMPAMSRTRLLQALPYALEEELIADVEELHFAAGDQEEGGAVPVAIVANDKMREWLDQLQLLGVTPAWMGSSVFALTYNVAAWPVAVFDNSAILRMETFAGCACDVSALPVFLEAAISQSDIPPESINIKNYTGRLLNVTLSIPVQENMYPEADFLESITNINGINLLQSKYASKHQQSFKLKHGWKITTYLACLFVLLLFLKPIVSNYILGQKQDSQTIAIANIYKRYFPESSKMVAPKERLTEKWQQLTTGNSDNQVLMMLAEIGKAIKESPDIHLKRFEYQSNAASVELQAQNSETFSTFTDLLRKIGLNVKEENANLVEGKLSANIQISAS